MKKDNSARGSLLLRAVFYSASGKTFGLKDRLVCYIVNTLYALNFSIVKKLVANA